MKHAITLFEQRSNQEEIATTLTIGACSREIIVESDDQTVLVASFGSNVLTIINAAK